MMWLSYIAFAFLSASVVTMTGTADGQLEKEPEYDVFKFRWFDSIERVREIVESYNGTVDTFFVADLKKSLPVEVVGEVVGAELFCINTDDYNPRCEKTFLYEDMSGRQYSQSGMPWEGSTTFHFLNFGDSNTRLVGVERVLNEPHSEYIFAVVGKRLAQKYGKVSTAYPYSGKRDPKVVFGPITGGVFAWTDRSSKRLGEIKYHQVWETPHTKVEHIYGILKLRSDDSRDPITRTHHVKVYESVERWTLWREASDRFLDREESEKMQEAEKRLDNIDFE